VGDNTANTRALASPPSSTILARSQKRSTSSSTIAGMSHCSDTPTVLMSVCPNPPYPAACFDQPAHNQTSPVQRVVSAYYFCKQKKQDPLCASFVLDAADTDLRTFARHWGNFGMRQVSLRKGTNMPGNNIQALVPLLVYMLAYFSPGQTTPPTEAAHQSSPDVAWQSLVCGAPILPPHTLVVLG